MRAPSDKRRATMRPRPAPNVWLHSTDCAAAYPTASAMPYSERVAEPEAPLRPRQHRTAQPRYRVASFNYRDGKPFKIRAPAQCSPHARWGARTRAYALGSRAELVEENAQGRSGHF